MAEAEQQTAAFRLQARDDFQDVLVRPLLTRQDAVWMQPGPAGTTIDLCGAKPVRGAHQ
jgi:hypothetical protein